MVRALLSTSRALGHMAQPKDSEGLFDRLSRRRARSAHGGVGQRAAGPAGVLRRLLRLASCLQHHISANEVSHELTGRIRCRIDKLSFRI